MAAQAAGEERTVQVPMVPNEMASAIIADVCRQDEDWAQRLRTDCKRMITESAGGPVPALDGCDIETVQNTPDTVHVALPAYSMLDAESPRDNEALEDDDLDMVSGGLLIIASIVAALGVVGTAMGVGASGTGIGAAVAAGALVCIGIPLAFMATAGAIAGIGGAIKAGHIKVGSSSSVSVRGAGGDVGLS